MKIAGEVRHHKVNRLGLTVPEKKIRRVERGDITSVGILHDGVHADARDVARFNDCEWFQLHGVAYGVPDRVVRLDRERARLERIRVFPLGDVRWPVGVGGDQHVVQVEADGKRDLGTLWRGHARDDPYTTGKTGPAERRRDAHGQLWDVRIAGCVQRGPSPARA